MQVRVYLELNLQEPDLCLKFITFSAVSPGWGQSTNTVKLLHIIKIKLNLVDRAVFTWLS